MNEFANDPPLVEAMCCYRPLIAHRAWFMVSKWITLSQEDDGDVLSMTKSSRRSDAVPLAMIKLPQ
jgi:hypothetical protein